MVTFKLCHLQQWFVFLGSNIINLAAAAIQPRRSMGLKKIVFDKIASMKMKLDYVDLEKN